MLANINFGGCLSQVRHGGGARFRSLLLGLACPLRQKPTFSITTHDIKPATSPIMSIGFTFEVQLPHNRDDRFIKPSGRDHRSVKAGRA